MWRCRIRLLWAAAAVVVVLLNTAIASTDIGKRDEEEHWSPKKIKACPVLPSDGADDPLEVECEGLSTLKDASMYVTSEQRSRVTSLTVSWSNLTRITLDDLQGFPALTSLALNNSLMSGWESPQGAQVPKVTRLVLNQCWDHFGMKVKQTHPAFSLTVQMLESLPALKQFYLVECYLYNLHMFTPPPSLPHIYIIGGGIECREESLWIMEQDVSNTTICFILIVKMDGFDIRYSFKNHNYLTTMKHWQAMIRDCPNKCTCTMTGVKTNSQPMILVNCTNIGLKQIPEVIPLSTTTINLSHNSISNISRLFTNVLYQNIDQIFLQYNQITYMDGRLFYRYAHNRNLDLMMNISHNLLSHFPVREVQRMYDEARKKGTQHLPLFIMGYNPWDCDDCSFLPAFQKIVYHQFRTEVGIRCRDGPNEETAQQLVIKLDVDTLCRPDPPLLSPMDVLILCLVGLLILFLLNFLHNFYQYRRHSKLPWIITKLPCC